MAKGNHKTRVRHEPPPISLGAHRAHIAAMEARGGLTKPEQAMAKRMAATGSNAATIRVELGGRYTTEQIERAIAA